VPATSDEGVEGLVQGSGTEPAAGPDVFSEVAGTQTEGGRRQQPIGNIAGQADPVVRQRGVEVAGMREHKFADQAPLPRLRWRAKLTLRFVEARTAALPEGGVDVAEQLPRPAAEVGLSQEIATARMVEEQLSGSCTRPRRCCAGQRLACSTRSLLC
jgi:hypothetical protein